MMGAAILAAKACLRSGVGKLTCIVEPTTYSSVQVSVPEAVILILDLKEIAGAIRSGHYQAIGIGPGLSQHPSHSDTLEAIGMQQVPTVLDADVLNHVAVITPHPGEYQRLFGDQADPADMSRKYGVYIILKGHQTSVNTPEGRMYINQSGNPRMATAGSGDVLTGILTGLLARGYPVDDAARLGVFLHGLAGELAAQKYGQESLIASDIIDQLPEAFLSLQKSQEMGTGL